MFEIHSVIKLLVIGFIAGWLAGKIVKGSGSGIIANIAIGVVGAFIGSYVLNALHVHIGTGDVDSLIGATVGAVILLFVVGLVRRR